MKVYYARANMESRIKYAKNTLRWDKTSCHRFEANQARLKMGALGCNLLHMIRDFNLSATENWDHQKALMEKKSGCCCII